MLSLTEFSNEDLTGSDRFDSWFEIAARSLMPVFAKTDAHSDPRVSLRVLTMEDVQVSRVNYASLQVSRTPRLIRQSDPEAYQVNVFLQGSAVISQSGREANLTQGQFVVIDSSHPFQARRSCLADAPSYLLQVPRRSVRLPSQVLGGLTAVSFDARRGLAAMFCQWLQNIITRAHEFSSEQAASLAAVTTDLISMVVADSLETTAEVTPQAHQQVLRMRIDQFIENHLGNPDLTPATVAAAHHVSLRHLQQLFAASGDTPAAWIRHRRLERCLRDLANPCLRQQPVYVVAARWGFTGQAHFSRLFRATYGITAAEYRRSQLSRRAQNESNPCADGQ
jgi:AraC-like DNA-binding protein